MPAPSCIRIVYAALVESFKMPIDQILSPGRTSEPAFIRQVGMCALQEKFSFSSYDAAAAFDRKSHGTALHASASVLHQVSHSDRRRAQVAAFLQVLASKRRSLTTH